MPFIKIYIHFVWTTKNFLPLLNGKTLREKVKSHILENCINKGIHVDQLAVQKEHCHCLIYLGKEQTMETVIAIVISGIRNFLRAPDACCTSATMDKL